MCVVTAAVVPVRLHSFIPSEHSGTEQYSYCCSPLYSSSIVVVLSVMICIYTALLVTVTGHIIWYICSPHAHICAAAACLCDMIAGYDSGCDLTGAGA